MSGLVTIQRMPRSASRAELRLLDYAVDPRPAGLPEWYGGQAGAAGP